MNILQVNTLDKGGGAARIVENLHKAYRENGHNAWVAAGKKRSDDSSVIYLDNKRFMNPWARFWLTAADRLLPPTGRVPAAGIVSTAFKLLGQPLRHLEILMGRDDFNLPAARHILSLTPEKPDIFHCHNLHGGYFDLRALPFLCREVPVVLTLHDVWVAGGHCAYPLDCGRWKTGCGECPDITGLDAANFNWQRKKKIFAQCRLYVATPSRWLMDIIAESILGPAIADERVIPNGVDTDKYCPGDRREAREKLGMDPSSKILLFAGAGVKNNRWKDYGTIEKALKIIADKCGDASIILNVLGQDAPSGRAGHAEIRFIPYVENTDEVAQYYRSADVYVHAAKGDNFPNAVLEAQACGTPVVATAVGGIPEQMKSMRDIAPEMGIRMYDANEATGVLVPKADPETFASAVARLLHDEPLRAKLGENAVRYVRRNFDVKQQAKLYLDWFGEILGKWKFK